MRIVREKFTREQQREPLARIFDEFVDAVAACVEARLAARPAKRLYNVAEAAIYLGRTESAIREMLRSGKLKRANREDRRVMFDRYDLDAWIEASKD